MAVEGMNHRRLGDVHGEEVVVFVRELRRWSGTPSCRHRGSVAPAFRIHDEPHAALPVVPAASVRTAMSQRPLSEKR